MLSKIMPSATVTASVVLGVLIAGLVLEYGRRLPIISDARNGYN